MPRITVGVRVKPEEASKLSRGIHCRDDTNTVELTVSGTKHEFQFDKIFAKACDQESLFRKCAPAIIDDVLDGYNGCILTYGQTGAGKTYTMSGPPSENYEERGLVMRSASYIFQKCAKLSDSISIRLSVLEIYNENLIDLLREPVPTTFANVALPKLTIIETSSGVVVPALYILPVSSEDDAYTKLLEAYSNRVVAEHQLNRRSSRSHVLYTFYITRTRSEDDVIQSKLHLVDLAGSERVEKTGSTGVVQKEASYINKSLSFLEQVVLALSQAKRDHIPYRQSKLTYLIKDSLGGNCNTMLIACVWPHADQEYETLSTLRFATRMKCIENHPVRNNLVSKEPVSSRLLQQIESLKKELIMRDVVCGLDPWVHELTKAQKLRTMELASYLALEPPMEGNALALREDVPVRSLSQINMLAAVMRNILWEACKDDPQRVGDTVRRAMAKMTGMPLEDDITADSEVAEGEAELQMRRQQQYASMSPRLAAAGTMTGGMTHRYTNTDQLPPQPYDTATMTMLMSPEGGGGPSGSAPVVWPDTDNGTGGGGVAGEEYNATDMPGLLLQQRQPSKLAGDSYYDELPQQEGKAGSETLTFDDFITGSGKALHESYLETKEALKTNKQRQKEIVGILNKRKAIIDELTEGLNTANAQQAAVNDIQGLHEQLDIAKKEYRAAKTELTLCKSQINETDSLKKRAMAALMRAYDQINSGGGFALPSARQGPPAPAAAIGSSRDD